MKKWKYLLIPLVLVLAGFLVYLGAGKPIRIEVDGAVTEIYTHALTVKGALHEAGISFNPQDALEPPAGRFLSRNTVILLEHARPVTIISANTENPTTFLSSERLPVRLCAQAGILLSASDRVLWNSIPFLPEQTLPPALAYVLQIQKAGTIEITASGEVSTLESTAATLGSALWEAGIRLSASDHIFPSPETPLGNTLVAELSRGVPLTIRIGAQEIFTHASGATTGETLARAGISLQGLDYSIPPEDQPLPLDGVIQVIRVQEEVVLEQTPIPYESEFVEDPDLELDQRKVIEPGQYGTEVTRLRVRYENGEQVSRLTESRWRAMEPKPEKIGYGTKIVLHTIDTPSGPAEYWRAVTVYATSYSPCRSGTTKCHYGTASGRPVQRGVIGVSRAWYNLLANQPVYVPGYGLGVIADVGGGVPGKYWIDLGFSDEDFETWHQNTVIYFLTPVPASVPWILP